MIYASKIIFYRHLQACAKAGLPPARAVEIANEACEQESFSSGLLALRILEIMGAASAPVLSVSASTLQDVAGRLRGGGEFSKVLNLHPAEFSAWEIAVVKAGEKTGRLDQAFGFIEEILDRRRAAFFAQAAKSAGPAAAMMMIPWIIFAPIAFFGGPAIDLGLVVISYAMALGPRLLSRRGVSYKPKDSHEFTKMRFAQCLAWMIKAGLSVDESIELAASAAGLASIGPMGSNETAQERLGHFRIFSNEELGSVRVGEVAGKLDMALETLAQQSRSRWEVAQTNALGPSAF